MQFQKSHIALMLAATLGLSACNTDDDNFVKDDSSVLTPTMLTLSVVMENDCLSKSSLIINEANSTTFSFESGDALSVFINGNNSQFTYFKKQSNIELFTGNAEGSTTIYALFPYSETATFSNGTVAANIPQVQDGNLSPSKFSPYLYSVGYTDKASSTLKLKNACSLIWLDVADIQSFSSIKIESDKNIAGNFNITVSTTDGSPTITDGDATSIVINNPKTNIIPVIPHDVADYTVTFYRKDGTSFSTTRQNVASKRSQMAYFTKADAHKASYNTGVDGQTINPTLVSENQDFTLPKIGTVEKSGYNFLGWKSADGTIYAAGSILNIGTEDMTFEAEWTKDFVLTYSIRGQRIQKYLTFKYNEEIILDEAPVLENSKFLYWNDGDGNRQPGATIKPNKNVTVTALFDSNKYLVTVDANGGAFNGVEETKSEYFVVGEPINLYEKFNYPSREGYDFGGFYDNPDLAGSKVTTVATQDQDIVLYARWIKKYTYKFLKSNGELIIDDGYEALLYYNPVTTHLITLDLVNNLDDYVADDEIATGYWIDQDGNKYKNGESILISTLEELKDLEFTIEVEKL